MLSAPPLTSRTLQFTNQQVYIFRNTTHKFTYTDCREVNVPAENDVFNDVHRSFSVVVGIVAAHDHSTSEADRPLLLPFEQFVDIPGENMCVAL